MDTDNELGHTFNMLSGICRDCGVPLYEAMNDHIHCSPDNRRNARYLQNWCKEIQRQVGRTVVYAPGGEV